MDKSKVIIRNLPLDITELELSVLIKNSPFTSKYLSKLERSNLCSNYDIHPFILTQFHKGKKNSSQFGSASALSWAIFEIFLVKNQSDSNIKINDLVNSLKMVFYGLVIPCSSCFKLNNNNINLQKNASNFIQQWNSDKNNRFNLASQNSENLSLYPISCMLEYAPLQETSLNKSIDCGGNVIFGFNTHEKDEDVCTIYNSPIFINFLQHLKDSIEINEEQKKKNEFYHIINSEGKKNDSSNEVDFSFVNLDNSQNKYDVNDNFLNNLAVAWCSNASSEKSKNRESRSSHVRRRGRRRRREYTSRSSRED